MHIAVDMDDVLVDFVGMVCDVVSRDFGVEPPITKDDITDWDFGQFLDQHIGQDWWSWLETKAYLWGTKAKPIPGAIGAMEKLRRAGHRLEVVTSKPEWGERYVFTWLDRYCPVVHGVTIVPLGGDKTTWTEATLLIDDRPKNVDEWVASRGGRTAILFPAAHNYKYTPALHDRTGRVFRAKDWGSVLRWVERWEKMDAEPAE